MELLKTKFKDAFLINYSLLEGQKYNFGKATLKS